MHDYVFGLDWRGELASLSRFLDVLANSSWLASIDCF
jgi:hypothetical protein